MDYNEVRALVADFTQIGYMEAVRAYEPERDLVRLKDIKSWLKFMHYDTKVFERLVKTEVVKAKRKGTSINSPLYYSKTEIKKALAALKIERIRVNNLLNQ